MIIVDSMLGKLSRYLRLIGYEVEYIGSDKDDSYIISICKDRLMITRDRQLHERVANSILLRSFDTLEQLKELKGKLPPAEHSFMELCSVCGTIVERAELNGDVPDYVNKNAKEIFRCKKCGRYYWNGSHTDHFRKQMEMIGYEIH
ncbi:MAG: Mut7-C RNAse domain-containing protein [Candidatus Thermoplasmatota archaeon]|jgi:uncharacterized protein with PIN domain|nr:Mut7-C RNAse domain-containing protein [Candidatus Thermoplasmatota archaeon]MCL5788918.1 Mut7-C RNAse domain-containing protein [Candidatus Thermoplasmatota archaeon]